MKPNIMVCSFLAALFFFACSKQNIVENETQNLNSLLIDNTDLKIETLFNEYHTHVSPCINAINSVHFVNEFKGVCIANNAMGQRSIFTTKDRGVTWDVSFMSPHIDTSIQILEIKVIDKKTLIGIGFKTVKSEKSAYFVIKSNDFGATWETIYSSTESNLMYTTIDEQNNLYALNTLLNSYAASKTEILKSTDLGRTWQNMAVLELSDVNSIKALSPDRLMVNSTSKGKFISNDAGKTWLQDLSNNLFPINSFDYNFGKGFGFSLSNYNADILKSEDLGSTWVKSSNTPLYLKNLKIVSPKAVFIFGETSTYSNQSESRMIYTIDTGISWKEIAFYNNKNAQISFYDDKNGYIIANNGLYKVTLK